MKLDRSAIPLPGRYRLGDRVQRGNSRGLQRDRHAPIQLHTPATAQMVFHRPAARARRAPNIRRTLPPDAASGTYHGLQMPVVALARYKRSADVRPVLLDLIHDSDVGLHAMAALRRVLGAEHALPYIEEVQQINSGSQLEDQATREIRKRRKALDR